MLKFWETFTKAAGPHWLRTAIVIGGVPYTLFSLGEGWAQAHGFAAIFPTWPKVAYSAAAIAGLLVFWFWKYAHDLRLAAEPKMKLVQIVERRDNKIDAVEQTFTLKVKNAGSVPLNHCIVKVDDMVGSDPHESQSLKTYRSGEGGIGAFMLKVGETEEIFLTKNAVTKGDTFVHAMLMYDGPFRWIDPDVESEMLIGLYSEAAPTFVTLKLSRNAKGFMVIQDRA